VGGHSCTLPSLKEQKEIVEIYAKLREAEAKLIGPGGKAGTLPNNLYSFLLRLLADLRAGNAVTILQSSHELTTIEASKILGMSRQFLVQLLGRNPVPQSWQSSPPLCARCNRIQSHPRYVPPENFGQSGQTRICQRRLRPDPR
jgi:hypothetical protein